MRQLLKFELKKILHKKVNQIAMTLGLLLIVVSDVLLIHGESLSAEGGNEIKGVEAIERQAEIENALTSELSEEFLTEFLWEYQHAIQENPLEYDYSLIEAKVNLYSLIAANYAEWNDQWDWEDLNQITTEKGIHFYEKRLEKIETLLNAEYSFGNYTDYEKDYWLQKAEGISTPFVWGSKAVWDIIWRGIKILLFQCFVISICIAPIFAGEYQNRTDALILSSKHGKNKLILAKIVAAFVFTLCYMVLCGIFSIGINVAVLGVDGWNIPIQLWDTIIPYEFNAAEACALNVLMMLLISFLLTALTLLFSTVCKNQMIALAIDILLFFGTVFLPFSKTSKLWNHILYLCPVYTSDLKNVFNNYVSYQFGNRVISYLDMTVITYVVIIMICLCCAGINFKNHQIGK